MVKFLGTIILYQKQKGFNLAENTTPIPYKGQLVNAAYRNNPPVFRGSQGTHTHTVWAKSGHSPMLQHMVHIVTTAVRLK